MLKKTVLVSAMASGLMYVVGPIFAAEAAMQNQAQEQVYGSQLMTVQERAEYQAKMRTAKSVEVREKIRAEHHEAMQVRAKEEGVTLTDEPRRVEWALALELAAEWDPVAAAVVNERLAFDAHAWRALQLRRPPVFMRASRVTHLWPCAKRSHSSGISHETQPVTMQSTQGKTS